MPSPIRYTWDTPAECVEHLDGFWRMGEKRGQKGWRIRFAWLPVALWDKSRGIGHVREISERVWFRNVVECYTLAGNWIAFKDYQLALNLPKQQNSLLT